MRVTRHTGRARQVVPVGVVAVLPDDLDLVPLVVFLAQPLASKRRCRTRGHDRPFLARQVSIEGGVHLERKPAIEEPAWSRQGPPDFRFLHDIVVVDIGHDHHPSNGINAVGFVAS